MLDVDYWKGGEANLVGAMYQPFREENKIFKEKSGLLEISNEKRDENSAQARKERKISYMMQ